MPRPLSSLLRRAAYAAQTGEVLLALLRISHHSFNDTIRVVSDSRDLLSRGHIYQRYPFMLAMPRDSDEAPPRVTLKVDNVDRRIAAEVRQARAAGGSPIRVELELVLAATPDVVEAGPLEFAIRDVTFDAGVLEAELRYEDLLNEPFPADTFSQSRTPGIF